MKHRKVSVVGLVLPDSNRGSRLILLQKEEQDASLKLDYKSAFELD